MNIDEYPSAWVIVLIVLTVCFTHYCIPAIHYYCIGICKTEKYKKDETESDSSTTAHNETVVTATDIQTRYAVTKEEIKDEFKYEKSVSRVLSMHFTFWLYGWITYFA